jgi:hypothetical protein
VVCIGNWGCRQAAKRHFLQDQNGERIANNSAGGGRVVHYGICCQFKGKPGAFARSVLSDDLGIPDERDQ